MLRVYLIEIPNLTRKLLSPAKFNFQNRCYTHSTQLTGAHKSKIDFYDYYDPKKNWRAKNGRRFSGMQIFLVKTRAQTAINLFFLCDVDSHSVDWLGSVQNIPLKKDDNLVRCIFACLWALAKWLCVSHRTENCYQIEVSLWTANLHTNTHKTVKVRPFKPVFGGTNYTHHTSHKTCQIITILSHIV